MSGAASRAGQRAHPGQQASHVCDLLSLNVNISHINIKSDKLQLILDCLDIRVPRQNSRPGKRGTEAFFTRAFPHACLGAQRFNFQWTSVGPFT